MPHACHSFRGTATSLAVLGGASQDTRKYRKIPCDVPPPISPPAPPPRPTAVCAPALAMPPPTLIRLLKTPPPPPPAPLLVAARQGRPAPGGCHVPRWRADRECWWLGASEDGRARPGVGSLKGSGRHRGEKAKTPLLDTAQPEQTTRLHSQLAYASRLLWLVHNFPQACCACIPLAYSSLTCSPVWALVVLRSAVSAAGCGGRTTLPASR